MKTNSKEMLEGVEEIASEWLKRMTDFIGPACMTHMRNKYISDLKRAEELKNMTKTVIFDIDDTIGCLRERLELIYRKHTGDDTISYKDWTEYHVQNRYGVSFDGLSELFIQDKSLEIMKPHEGIVEVTAILKARGYKVEFVTARGWLPGAYDITKTWLDNNFISYDRINIVPLFQCKEEATRHIENIVLFVDDRHDHCTAMANSGRVGKSLVYRQPWNSLQEANYTPNVDYISSLYEVLDYLPE